MGAETNLSSPQLEPPKSRETETLLNDDQNWMAALRESVSFRRFLSEPLEWDTTGHVSPATMAHVQSPPTAQLDLPVHAAVFGPQSAVLRTLEVLDEPRVVIHACPCFVRQ
ncbi:hypothetical protein ACQJBY_022972 [Aegilops geniculata]